MAAGDVVSPRLNQTTPSSVEPQPTHFGKITAHAAPGAPTVLWDTGLSTVMAATSDANLGLDVIETAEDATLASFAGQTVVRIASSGPTADDPSGGTSREFAGLVVAIYKRTPLGATPGSGNDCLLVKSGDTFFEDVATEFVVLAA